MERDSFLINNEGELPFILTFATAPKMTALHTNNTSFPFLEADPIILCPNWMNTDRLLDVKVITSVVTLGVINAAVIVGNFLVILAVFASAKLRTVTNFLIVSLAAADLLVGITVLPYSITLEVLEVWIFGEVWCQMWLAVDVWLCTASILNLCAISVDRYLAITRPVHYRSIMSPRRVKLLIAAVWVLSFVICFPPLVGWNDRVMDSSDAAFDNEGLLTPPDVVSSAELVSEGSGLGNSTNHSIYTYLPSNFSDFLNETRDVNDSRATSTSSRHCTVYQCALISNKGYVIYSALGSFYIPMLIMLFFYWRIYVAALRTTRALQRGFRTTKSKKVKSSEENMTLRIHRGHKPSELPSHSHVDNRRGDILVPRRMMSVVSPTAHHEARTGKSRSTNGKHYHVSGRSNFCECSSALCPHRRSTMDNHHLSGTFKDHKSGRNIFSRLSRRNVRWHAKRFHTEEKATKTVGIIVGGFILCWLPFFTVYLTRAFCETCCPDLLFTVFFWLGYCNSAINPLIYGMFSKDFRFAFKKILCRCRLKDDGVSSLIRQIHLPTFFEAEDDHQQDDIGDSQ